MWCRAFSTQLPLYFTTLQVAGIHACVSTGYARLKSVFVQVPFTSTTMQSTVTALAVCARDDVDVDKPQIGRMQRNNCESPVCELRRRFPRRMNPAPLA